MYNEKIIGKKIAEFREKKNLSRAQLADYMPVSVQAVGKWERGESLPDIIALKKLTDILEIDINALFSGGDVLNANAGVTDFVKNSNKDTKPEWNMSAANWKDADFSGLKNLADKFNWSNVTGCKFSNSDLSEIVFKGNNIKDCDFSNADLSGSKFSMSNIPDNNFVACNFQKSFIKMCDVHECDFSGCNFLGAEISGTSLNKNIFKGAIWLKTSFINSVFSNVIIDSDITDCSFSNCVLKNTQFNGVIFRNTFFKNIKCKNIKFNNCKADKITYSFLKHTNAVLSGIEIIEQ